MSALAARLAVLLPDIPVHETNERGPYHEGINVWPYVRHEHSTYPFRGELVTVMYDVDTDQELYDEWRRRVREILLAEYPDRYRPIPRESVSSSMLIQGPGTKYARWRKGHNAWRSMMGWKPLHEVGK